MTAMEEARDVATKRTVRVLMNGCFDLLHAGHYNALRQSKFLDVGPDARVHLVAAVHSDSAIASKAGCLPVFSLEERISLLHACKWVDEVVVIDEYAVRLSFLDQHNCELVTHGDDMPKISTGEGMYDESMRAGRFRLIRRTEGTSTTKVIERLLNKMDWANPTDGLMYPSPPGSSPKSSKQPDSPPQSSFGNVVQPMFQEAGLKDRPVPAPILTVERLVDFKRESPERPLSSVPRRQNAQKVVYVDGAFDLLNPAHIVFLKKARALGDFLIVGLHSDRLISEYRGSWLPVAPMEDRALCLLACKYVSDVVLGVPWYLTRDMIASLDIQIVASGSVSKAAGGAGEEGLQAEHPYQLAKELGIYVEIPSETTMTTVDVMRRIASNREAIEKRTRKATQKETEYEADKATAHEQSLCNGFGIATAPAA
eukprot:gnl/TRDRNA2_/TRDRNA2_194912_c0_seq1.p1 gnl/TRDRNA2_/TRDRNA2_194912_c0~~gnl/TRDRNA2_/TRDRNA2_194912_c0_seq1.p1  ORF type:complete len:439 (-),score=75.68 gnl/TRDRNA2_/TRDRNA2_194912_c0_seq1:99-1376(-)